MPTQRKKEIIAKLIERLERAEAIYFTNYQGLTHQELEQLRSKIKEQNADYTIVKNTLFHIALKSIAFKEFESDALEINGPTAVLFAYQDAIKPLQAFTQNFKERLKAAIAFGNYLTNAQLQRLVDLEPEKVLHAKFVSRLASPLSGLAYALNWNLQRLVVVIDQIKQSVGR